MPQTQNRHRILISALWIFNLSAAFATGPSIECSWLAHRVEASLDTGSINQERYEELGKLDPTTGDPLPIEADFKTMIRDERRSTNYLGDAFLFRQWSREVVDRELGEYVALRDVPERGTVNITRTTYPFSRESQGKLGAKLRIRQYGAQKATLKEPAFQNSGARGLCKLELKVKTELDGVVLKPSLTASPKILRLLFSGEANFVSGRAEAESLLLALNKTDIEKGRFRSSAITDVLDAVQEFYRLDGPSKPQTSSIEYRRKADVVKVVDRNTKEENVIQITYDQAVAYRENVEPTEMPWTAAEGVEPAVNYPVGRDGIVVIEQKTGLRLLSLYQQNPQYVRENIPTFWALRQYYERLQAATVAGYEADRGKAGNIIKRSEW